MEELYENSTFERRRKQALFIVIAIIITGCLNLVNELKIIEFGGNEFSNAIILRSFTFVVGLSFAYFIQRTVSCLVFNYIMAFYVVYTISVAQFLGSTHPNFAEMGPVSIVVTVVMIYLFLPVRLYIVAGLGVYASIVLWVAWAIWRDPQPPADNAFRVILLLLTINVAGLVTASSRNRNDRLLFSDNRALADEVAEHKRTAEELRRREAQLIEARHRAEQALATELATLDEYRKFISVITHEFRNPLAIISSHTQLAQLQTGLSQKDINPSLSAIKRATERLQGLFERWLQSGCIPAQALIPILQPVRIADLFAQLERQAPCPATLTLSVERPEAGLEEHADPSLLLLAMQNLIDNAGKFSPPGGRVSVTAGRMEDRTYMRVSDQGYGIAPADQPHVFEVGYRGAHSGTATGSGFGLFLVSQIAAAHKGEVTLTSTVGKGSEFTLWLPRRDPRP